MRLKYKTYRIGDKRLKKGFLFFPKYIKNEWRWLEFACWLEVADWKLGIASDKSYIGFKTQEWIDL